MSNIVNQYPQEKLPPFIFYLVSFGQFHFKYFIIVENEIEKKDLNIVLLRQDCHETIRPYCMAKKGKNDDGNLTGPCKCIKDQWLGECVLKENGCK